MSHHENLNFVYILFCFLFVAHFGATRPDDARMTVILLYVSFMFFEMFGWWFVRNSFKTHSNFKNSVSWPCVATVKLSILRSILFFNGTVLTLAVWIRVPLWPNVLWWILYSCHWAAKVGHCQGPLLTLWNKAVLAGKGTVDLISLTL